MRRSTFHYLVELALCSGCLLSACGGDGSSNPAPITYSIGGTLSGLASGASVVLEDNGGDSTTVSANGSFSFSVKVADSAAYAVAVLTQPTGQTCSVAAGTGAVSGGNVTSVHVVCAINTFTISGIVSGLNSAAQVTVQNNGADPTTVKANGVFIFAAPIPYDSSYSVTVATQPTAQTCTVTAGTGADISSNVSDVRVSCGTATESVIHTFNPDGITPNALIQASNGNFYGTTSSGGATGHGTVFRITPAGVEAVLYSFGGGTTDGASPTALIQGSDGNFYGTTGSGGTSNNGTVFKITPGGVETVLYSFTGSSADGTDPNGLIQGSDGNFYGTTFGPDDLYLPPNEQSYGTVFKITPGGVLTLLHAFTPATTDGARPSALIQGRDGNFYGATSGDTTGTSAGAVFKITPTGVETVLYFFKGGSADGSSPNALIQGSDGNFYGTTFDGGSSSDGTAFKITPAGVETVLYSFTNATTNCAAPNSLIQASDGNFYGYCLDQLNDDEIFKITPAGVESVLPSFKVESGTTGVPTKVLIQASDENFYGTTGGGGANGNGTVFKVSLAGIETVLYSFYTDGASPNGLLQGSDGNYYGTTISGGSSNDGTVFSIASAGVETVLHSFAGSAGFIADGASPGALIQANDGTFYGVTASGGMVANGTVFETTSTGVEVTLYSFVGGTTDGASPVALTRASDGNLYGTTKSGGSSGNGTVFKVTAAGVETELYSFAGGTTDGGSPVAMIQGSDGNFYGITSAGGTSGNGTLFKVTPAGVETVLHYFGGGTTDGASPATLIQASDGNFYGTTGSGGTSDKGTAFKVTPAGVETVLHAFAGGTTDGASPVAFIQASDGNFYGTTSAGGTSNDGTIFNITTAGVETVLYSFVGGIADGAYPNDLIQGSDGYFYGTTLNGGPSNAGTVFKF